MVVAGITLIATVKRMLTSVFLLSEEKMAGIYKKLYMQEEIEFIKANYGKITIQKVSEDLFRISGISRCRGSIQNKAHHLGVTKKKGIVCERRTTDQPPTFAIDTVVGRLNSFLIGGSCVG